MRKLFLASILALMMSFTMSQGPWLQTSVAADKVYDLSLTTEYMDKHPTVKNAFFPWIKEVGELSGGGLKVTYFNPNTLAPTKDAYDSTVSGMIDIGSNYCGRNPGKFPLNTVMELPMIVPGAEAGSLVTWELFNKFPEWQAEYKDVKMLWQWASATYQLHTTKKLVRTLDDLEGMKIIGWTPTQMDIIKSLGANPLQIAPTDTYLALQRGMADGVMCPLAPVRSFKISDATKYHTVTDVNTGPFWAGVNKDVWNDLPEDFRKILVESTGTKMARASGKTLDEGAAADAAWMKSEGHQFYVLPEKEKVKWFARLQGMHEKWVEKMEGKGYKNARSILNEAIKLGKEYAKTTGRGFVE